MLKNTIPEDQQPFTETRNVARRHDQLEELRICEATWQKGAHLLKHNI